MIGGEDEVVAPARPDLRRARAGRRRRRAARPGRTGEPSTAEAGLPALRPGRRRALREDGPQRHRVRADGRLRRGPERAQARERRGQPSARADAETAPLRDPEYYRYDLDIAEIAEVWRRGSVVASWLLDLTAAALLEDPELAGFGGRVSDSGEGRWTVHRRRRGGRPGPRADGGAVRRASVARRGRLRQQGPLGHAQAVRRPRGAGLTDASPGGSLQARGEDGSIAQVGEARRTTCRTPTSRAPTASRTPCSGRTRAG